MKAKMLWCCIIKTLQAQMEELGRIGRHVETEL